MTLTSGQRKALKRVFDRTGNISYARNDTTSKRNYFTNETYREFRKTVQPGPGCIMVPWCNMWLGIEPDGYTHS